MGNGRMGVMVWGEGRTLKLTLGRADLWDHRGGKTWTEEMSLATIRKLLVAKDKEGMKRVFERGGSEEKGLERPTILPLGRVELELPGEILGATLDPYSGVVEVRFVGGKIGMELAQRDNVLLLRGAGGVAMRGIPGGEIAGEAWETRRLPAPQRLDRMDLAGWVQELVVDPAVCVGWRAAGGAGEDVFLVTERGHDEHDAVSEASTLVSRAIAEGAERLSREAREWWAEFWSRAPKVNVPNATLGFMYTYGMYKLGASTNPRGVPCGLQGPWIEDYRTPPWSSDYHFNINVQMCYGPAYAGGHGRHFRPMWKMLESWEPMLREHARMFVGIDDGLMLPHAVDDRGTCMGGFWSGTVDHGCTAWVAKMMFDAWDYGLEEDAFLGDMVWRWLAGALNVYLAMVETREDGSVVLPVTVSPEYRSSEITAWGANASFQLGACHALLDMLEVAAERLGRTYEPVWTTLRQKLPRACVEEFGGKKQIMLWEGTPLEESHRHHSHLAGIAPFESFDPLSAEWKPVVDASLARWIDRGNGQWSGWCLSWASQLMSRVGNGTMAEWYIEAFDRFFVSSGGAPYHNVLSPGFSCMGASGLNVWNWQAMQIDGSQGSCSAVMDMLCHVRKAEGNVHHLFAGCPGHWREASFENMATPGGFRVSAVRAGGKVARLEVRATRAGVFRWKDGETVREVEMRAGEKKVVV